jgi:hypothetical protein
MRFRLTASYSLLLVQKRVTREKHTPCTGRAAPDSPALLATLGGCGTRRPLARPAQTVLADGPKRRSAARRRIRGPVKTTDCEHRSQYLSINCATVNDFFNKLAAFPHRGWVPFPVGDAEKRSGLRGCRRGLSEPSKRASSAAAEDRAHRREVSALAPKPSPPGRLFLVTSFGEAKEVTRRQAKGFFINTKPVRFA